MTKVPHIDRLHTVHLKATHALDELQREARIEVQTAVEGFDRLKIHCQQQALTIAELEAEVRDLRAQLALHAGPVLQPEPEVTEPEVARAHPVAPSDTLQGTLRAFFGSK